MDQEALFKKIFGDQDSNIPMTENAVQDGLYLSHLLGGWGVMKHIIEVMEEKKFRQISLKKLKLIMQSEKKEIDSFMERFN
jgi:hypothetical protein